MLCVYKGTEAIPVERGGETMLTSSLIRAFAYVDSKGKIALPRNLLLALDLKEKDAVELKLVGTGKAKKATLSKRQSLRAITRPCGEQACRHYLLT